MKLPTSEDFSVNNQKGFAQILLIVGIVILLGILGGVYYLKSRTTTTIENTPTSDTSSTSEPSSNEQLLGSTKNYKDIPTEGWVKYTSPEYNPYYTDKQIAEQEKVASGEVLISDDYKTKVKFSLLLPPDWKQSIVEKGIDGYKDSFGAGYIFTKNKLELRIGRFFAPGGNLCSKKMLTQPYIDIIDASPIIYRRNIDYAQKDYIPKGYTRFNVCIGRYEKDFDNFSSVSPAGAILFTLPENYANGDLEIMDKIITTLSITDAK